jgi:hypothetical protein
VACKNPWRLARGKRFPERFCWLLWGKVQPAGRCGPGRGKISEADYGERAAPDSGLHGRCCRVGAGFEAEGRHLVLLVADAQCEVMQRAANDGIGAVDKRLERWYAAVPPHEHSRCAGKVVRQLRRRLAGRDGVVFSGGMFGSTQCLRKLVKKTF